MKIAQSALNWEMEVRTWKSTFSPISMRDISLWEQKVTSALKKLPYLKSLNTLKTDDNDRHLTLKVILKDVESNQDGVLKDFMTVFSNYVVGDKRSLAIFTQTSDGFNLDFAALDRDECFVIAQVRAAYDR